MSKRVRNLLIILVVVALLAGGLSVLLVMSPKKKDNTDSSESQTSDTTVTLLDKTKNNSKTTVFKIEATVNGSSFEIAPGKDKVLCVSKYSDLPVNTSAVSKLTDDLLRVTADKKVKDSMDKPADFGFDKPTATYVVTYSDKSTAKFYVGNEEPLKTGHYFRMDGDNAVYLISTTDMYLAKAEAYISTTLVTPPEVKSTDSGGAASVVELTLSGSARDRDVQIHYKRPSDSDMQQLCTYVIDKPYKKTVSETVAQSMMASMTNLEAAGIEKVHPTKADLLKYGLETPYSTAKMQLGVVTTKKGLGTAKNSSEEAETAFYNFIDYTVHLGGKNSDGQYYAMLDGVDIVYLVAADAVPWATKAYEDLADNYLFLISIDKVSRLDVSYGGKTTQFDLKHTENKDNSSVTDITVTASGKTYNEENFRNLYQVFMTCPRSGKVSKAPTGTPEFSYKLYSTEGKLLTQAMFYKHSVNEYVVQDSTGDVYLTNASTVDKFVKQYQNYLASKTVFVG